MAREDEREGVPATDWGMASLVALAAKGLDKWLNREPSGPQPWDGVKLLHADELQGWSRFPRCQDVAALTYGDYRAGRRELARVRKRVSALLDARDRLAELDSDRVVTHHTEYLTVPRSLLRRPVRISLEHPRLPGTWLESDDGEIVVSDETDVLVAPGGWLHASASVRSVGPAHIVHAEEIRELTDRLAAITEEQRRDIDEVTNSRFGHPVLFVSHRWEAELDPDPTGSQLKRLSGLRKCWIIYDYSSFPQLPRTSDEQQLFEQILASMDELLDNVLVLASPDYLARGWLVFEYLVASLAARVVCDEVNDPRFVSLRDWSATHAPIAANPFRDSWESRQNNHINQMRLTAVNELLPVYRAAGFRTEHDHSRVTELLVEHLKRRLPPRKEHQEYLGEWKTTQWTDQDLELAFKGEMPIPKDISLPVRPFRVDAPTTVDEAVARDYAINHMTWEDKANPLGAFLR